MNTIPPVKVVDRRWWARGRGSETDEQSSLEAKPSLNKRKVTEKDAQVQEYLEEYRQASRNSRTPAHACGRRLRRAMPA